MSVNITDCHPRDHEHSGHLSKHSPRAMPSSSATHPGWQTSIKYNLHKLSAKHYLLHFFANRKAKPVCMALQGYRAKQCWSSGASRPRIVFRMFTNVGSSYHKNIWFNCSWLPRSRFSKNYSVELQLSGWHPPSHSGDCLLSVVHGQVPSEWWSDPIHNSNGFYVRRQPTLILQGILAAELHRQESVQAVMFFFCMNSVQASLCVLPLHTLTSDGKDRHPSWPLDL